MKNPKMREALEWMRQGGDSFIEALADAALNELRDAEAEASIAKSTLRDTLAAAMLAAREGK